MMMQNRDTLLFILIVCALRIQATTGMMTPAMVHRMIASAGRPPLQPHLQGTASADCLADLAALLDEETDLISVIDAIGKPQAGFLAGNLAWVGHYDECYNITDFKYCLSHISVPLNSTDINPGLNVVEIAWGLCVPVSCSGSDILSSLDDIFNAVIQNSSIDISSVNASSISCAKHPPAPYNTGFLVTIFIIGALATLLLLGAFLDCTLRGIDYKQDSLPSQELQRNEDESHTAFIGETGNNTLRKDAPTAFTKTWHQFLLCFAVNRNLSKLLHVQASEGSIDCLNGIRVISMSWVILGHVVFFALGIGIVGNPVYGFGLVSNFGFQAIANAFFSVDSFFFLSGLLVAYMTLGKMAKSGGSIPWLWFYFHRYWRLTPALGMTMLISLYIKPHMGDGPVWQEQTSDPACAEHWWTNLLYINNFYKGDCIGWVWYLANDMQFFIISPFILILLHRVPVLGLLSLCAMTIVSTVTTAILMVKHNFSAVFVSLFQGQALDQGGNFGDVIYIKPYCRISPYLIGMAMGYFLHKYKKERFKLHPSKVAAGWAIATATAMATVYGLYGSFHGNTLSTGASAIYAGLSKVSWAFSLCWLVFACRYGYGGWVNDFLSWKAWVPLSRITYSAYLLHPIILLGYFSNMKNNYFYSLYILGFEFPGLFFTAYAAAVVMALFIEFPLANMEKMFIPSSSKKKN